MYYDRPSRLPPIGTCTREWPARSAPRLATNRCARWIHLAGVLAVVGCAAVANAAEPADLVIQNARIYTADPQHQIASAVAITQGRFAYVGSDDEARGYIGDGTVTFDAGGQLILPGLVDSHLHPLGIVETDSCSLENHPLPLRELSAFVRDCIDRFQVPDGAWLTVERWNNGAGNEPDPGIQTIRAALDLASTRHPIQLRGDDGHHGAFNSAALARAADRSGQVVGYTRETIRTVFAQYRSLIGIEPAGDLNGTVDEEARRPLGLPASNRYAQLRNSPGRIVDALTSRGILLIQDAAARPENLALYEEIARRGLLTVRVNAAQYLAPEDFRMPDGHLDIDRAVKLARELRDRYADSSNIRADAIKIFADGVLEGDPSADPPTLPNAARTRPYLQPLFKRVDSKLRVVGYVNQRAQYCRAVQRAPAAYESDAVIAEFRGRHGFAPRQCLHYAGVLTLPKPELIQWATAFHRAGFPIHFHAIGDGAVAAALDAIEAGRRSDGIANRRDIIAHAQLVDPRDLARLGRDRINVAYTFAWMYTDPDYDMTVVPFINRVSINTFPGGSLHSPGAYYDRNAYAARTVSRAGGVLIAGSDAPVDSRDPRPFVNIEMAITRRLHGYPPLNPQEALSISEVLDAYTINGARALGRDGETGSIEIGKSADLVLVDQDVLQLAASGRADQIGNTRPLRVWFQGKLVFEADWLRGSRSPPKSATGDNIVPVASADELLAAPR